MSLQRKLTQSHLIVVIISSLLIAGLTLLGFWLYTLTDWSVNWVADNALIDADTIAQESQEWGSGLDADSVQAYLDEWYVTIDADSEALDDIALQEWFAVIAPDGTIVNSNYDALLPVGSQFAESDAPTVINLWPPDTLVQVDAFGDLDIAASYGREGRHSIGFAPIVTDIGDIIGYVYYRADNSEAALVLRQVAQTLGWGLLVATVVSVVISGIMGSRMARPFTRRLGALSDASAAFASGDFEQRVVVDGEDEIGKLSAEFNQMASQLSTQMDTVRDLTRLEERNRLARELHDAIKQQLFGLSLTVGSVPALLESKPAIARQRMEKSAEMVQGILEEMDAIIQQLRPASLEDRGLVTALSDLIEQWQSQTQIAVEWTTSGERELALQVEQAVYRIAQEALSNIARHAQAQHVTVSLAYELTELVLRVTDDGRGFDVATDVQAKSHGLQNMRERAAEIDAEFKMNTVLNRGTTLELRVPIAIGLI